ncbi:MAG: UDP-N-acetylmuramoyl-L-alanine-D-glutamate ligase [uncultured bacterium]|nr:MAG: UDP-N-acetylmuramoyl-L-alanine-D-glutamate ligase [uncultured bacterium]
MKKSVFIIGAGNSGLEAAKLAKAKGYEVCLYDDIPKDKLSDEKQQIIDKLEIKWENSFEYLKANNEVTVITSPGVDLRNPKFGILKNFHVISEIQFAWRWLKGLSVAVTGTNGKSTTCALIEHFLRNEKIDAIACGNYGIPLSAIVSDEKYSKAVKVVELSSFQLEHLENISPEVSICLDITENHLNRYDSMEDYVHAKLNLYNMNSKNSHWIIYHSIIKNYPDLKRHKNLTVVHDTFTEGELTLRLNEGKIEGDWNIDAAIDKSYLGLKHNIINVLFSLSAVMFLKGRLIKIANAINTFKPLHYRQEKVLDKNGLMVVNDSKSSSPDAVIKALDSYNEKTILILGGRNKQHTFEILKNRLENSDIKVVLYGESGDFIENVLKDTVKVKKAKLLKDALILARDWREEEKLILFSPACESFDQFKNYNDRGEHFNKYVSELF